MRKSRGPLAWCKLLIGLVWLIFLAVSWVIVGSVARRRSHFDGQIIENRIVSATAISPADLSGPH